MMTKLEQLIKELCPNGVQLTFIENICDISRGKVISKDYIRDNPGDYPVYSSQTENNGELGRIDTYAFEGEYLTWTTDGANAGSIFYRNEKFNITNVCGLLKTHDNVIARFLFYVLSIEAPKYVQKGMGNPKLMSNMMAKVKVPVPPLEVQAEIVKILDEYSTSVTALQQELESELTARKKQYEYYRDLLLDFGVHGWKSECEWRTVGELFEIRNGLNKEKEAFGKGKPIINFTDVYKNRCLANGSFSGLVDVTPDEIERYSARKGDVFFTRTSETKEDIGMSSTLIEDVPDCVFSGFVLRARPTTDLLLPKFCAYYFSIYEVRKQIVKYAAFTTRATTTGDKLSKIRVPIPTIEEQTRIVSILDRFDKLCNDISEGLPAEIEARRKQYEYYRDKLLSFEEVRT